MLNLQDRVQLFRGTKRFNGLNEVPADLVRAAGIRDDVRGVSEVPAPLTESSEAKPKKSKATTVKHH